MENKQEIRKKIKALKQQVSNEEKEIASNAVFLSLYKLPEWRDAKNILFYHSLPDELPTIAALEENSSNKTLFLPKVNGNTLDIHLYNPNELTIGSYNIKEPNDQEVISPEFIDLVIVPGIAFDKQFNRLGRGKGYYDRILSQTVNATKIGIGFDFQLLDIIPAESHDIKMDIIITPSFIIHK